MAPIQCQCRTIYRLGYRVKANFYGVFAIDAATGLYGTILVISERADFSRPVAREPQESDVAPPLVSMIGQLDDAASLPLYQQLQRGLRQAIEGKLLAPDDALPPERDLAEEFSVSRITVRKAIDGLVAEGLLTRRQGSGTFVSSRVEKNFSKLTSFTEDMIARGRTPRSSWLRKAKGSVTPEESLTMGLSPGTPVYRFHRLRFADDAPMALEYCTVPAFCLPSIDAVESSLYTALEH